MYIYLPKNQILITHPTSPCAMIIRLSCIPYTLYNSNIQISYMSKPNINTPFQYSTIITLISIDVIAHRRVLITGQNTQDDPHMGFHRMEDPQSCFSANHLSILDDFGVLPFKKIPLEKVTHIILLALSSYNFIISSCRYIYIYPHYIPTIVTISPCSMIDHDYIRVLES